MKKTISVVFALSLMMSCDKEFIELNPISTVNIDVLFKTDRDYNDAIVGAYSLLKDQGPNIWRFGDLRGDDTEQHFLTAIDVVNMDVFNIDINDPVLLNTWRNYYKIINRVNTVLSKIDEADAAIITNKERYIGEAKFLRALSYFELVRIFGAVPFVTTPLTIEESYRAGREEGDRIYDEIIIPDLLDAETKLPLQYAGAELGKSTRGAAKALLGKVYLTRRDFISAENKLQEVTTMGYALLDNFNDLFNYQKDEHHTEYIFDIEYEEGVALGSPFSNLFTPLNNGLMNFYGITGGGGGSNSGSPSDALFDLFEPNDQRMDITVARGYTDNNGNYIAIPNFDIRSFTKKYITRTLRASDSRANWKLIRYADVLLMYAEALNENSKTSQALEYLNDVHVRAGLEPLDNLTKEEVREKIYLERRLELYLEGHRWFDLVRTGRALSVMEPKGMKSYMEVFPIPHSQIQVINNNELFPQNPGYN